MLFTGAVCLKIPLGVCFLATGLIQSTLAVSEHPTHAHKHRKHTKIYRVLEKSEHRHFQWVEKLEPGTDAGALVWIESSEEKSSYPGTPSHLPPGHFLPGSGTNITWRALLSHPPSFPATWRTQRPVKWPSIACNCRVADLLRGDSRSRSKGS